MPGHDSVDMSRTGSARGQLPYEYFTEALYSHDGPAGANARYAGTSTSQQAKEAQVSASGPGALAYTI